MSVRPILVLCIALLSIVPESKAQSQEERNDLPVPPRAFDQPVRFDNLTLEDGLPQGSVYVIHQDAQGFMWFGTQAGVSRYDGHTFKNFSHIPFDSTSIMEAWVMDIDEGDDGALWLASTYRGLSVMDPATERFTHFRHERSDSTSLSDGWVSSVEIDRDGILWVGVRGGGLNRMDPEQPGLFEQFRHDPDDSTSLSHDGVLDISEDRAGRLWISTDNGLNRMDPETPGQFTHYFLGEDAAIGMSMNDPSRIVGVFERAVEPNVVWVGMRDGLLRLDVESGETRNVYPQRTFQVAADPNDEDVLWIATLEAGLVRFDVASETATVFQHDPSDPESLVGNTTWSVATDRSGTIWVGTNPDGISKFNPSAITFARISESPDGLAEASSWGMLVDSRGGLWITGTDRHVLQRMDLATGRVEIWEPDPANPADPTRPSGRPFVVTEDDDGIVWIGTAGGLNRFDPETRRFRAYRHDPSDSQSISSNNVGSIFVDRQGYVWVGTRNAGLCRLDTKSGSFTRFAPDPADSTSLGHLVVISIFEDNAGTIWVGTGVGLDRMEPSEPGRFRHYVHDPKNPQGITNGVIAAIHEREQEPGVLWLATSGGGLDRMDVRSGTFKHYTEQNSNLPNNTIYAVLEDADGRLWMSTNHGITRFDPETETFSNFGVEHGLSSLEFNQWAAAVDASGQMFFGSVKGINSFYPQAVAFNELPPPVALTDLRLFNVPVAPGPDSPLNEALSKTDRIELTYDQARNISLDFVALHFKNSNKNTYAYRLEGFDPDWIDGGTLRSATYTNLPLNIRFLSDSRVTSSKADSFKNLSLT